MPRPNYRTIGILHFEDGKHGFVDTKGKVSLEEAIIEMSTTKQYDTYFRVRKEMNLSNEFVLGYVECVEDEFGSDKHIKHVHENMKKYCTFCGG